MFPRKWSLSQNLHCKDLAEVQSLQQKGSKCWLVLPSWRNLMREHPVITRQELCLPDRLCGTTLWNYLESFSMTIFPPT